MRYREDEVAAQLALKALGVPQGPSQAERDLPSLRAQLRPVGSWEGPSGNLLGLGFTLGPVGSLPIRNC